MLPSSARVSVLTLRGHNARGGFVGGLIMATGVIAQYIVGGTIWVESRLNVHPLVLIGLGLLAAATAGLIAWSKSLPFLTSVTAHVHLPVLGDIHLSSTLLFDIGVYLLVIGATLLILVALAHQSLRRPRRAVMPVRTTPASPRSRAGDRMAIATLAIGILAGSGVWLLLRPRTFQVLLGLVLLSYATNIFIFGMGRLVMQKAPIIDAAAGIVDPSLYADPVPQALVLTAIVIGFATTALFLVVIIATRGMTGTDHVDAQGRDP